ncbi:wax ester synthase/diacylglycerol acyltransferase 11 [Cryptomeria japonica]|uniref:wax ester synthase/diacylglycerol acyltransferase 11 n=1 Tax=Cryptomeria japonica TaxID=3369 RepID=UPI0027DAA4CB|nr:wax ester synthase/diacylglycerol acyltransferase 11 [Cryptomeria japonica]
MTLMDDSKLAIRGPPGVEILPKVMTHLTFPMEDITKIKKSVGGTVNDVIMGVILYGFQRYLETTHSHGGNRKEMKKSRVTGLVAINTRVLSGLKDIKEMMKPESEAPWGNRFGLLHIPISTANVESPLDFVRRAKKIIDRKKMSREGFITGRLLSYLGREASAKCFYKTMTNATLTVSNLTGPMEKMALNEIPVKNMFFSVSGLPQTLLLTMVSYMGKLRLDVIGVKGYVDCDSLAKCFGECFEEIKEASNAL